MAAVPVPVDIAANGVLPSTTFNAGNINALRFLLTPPHATLRQTSAQTFTTGVPAAIQFNTEDVDTDVDGTGGHDNATNNTRFTARYPGWYAACPNAAFAANNTGWKFVWLAVNGSDVNASVGANPNDASASAEPAGPTKLVYLNAGDYLEAIGAQYSGGNLASIVSPGRAQPGLSVWWVSN